MMVRSRDLLMWNGKKRITPNLVFSLIRSLPPYAPQITFNPLLLQQKPPLLIFLPLVSWLGGFIQYRPGHLSYGLSSQLSPYFIPNSSPFCLACLRNLFFHSPNFPHTHSSIFKGTPWVPGAKAWIIHFDSWPYCC